VSLNTNDAQLIANALKIAAKQPIHRWSKAQLEVTDNDGDFYTIGPFDTVELLPNGVVLTTDQNGTIAHSPNNWSSVIPKEARR
jgi:hypothetical protein